MQYRIILKKKHTNTAFTTLIFADSVLYYMEMGIGYIFVNFSNFGHPANLGDTFQVFDVFRTSFLAENF